MSLSYDLWAQLYDSVYSFVTEDIPFYVDEARRSGGPVLELGCGTGRVAIPIAQAGVPVVGLDVSPAMLEVASRKAREAGLGPDRLELVRGDMRDFDLGRRFPLVIIPFRGFLALLTVEDQMRALACVRRHLAPGGRLVFNVFVPDLEMLVQGGETPVHVRDVTDPETGRRWVLWDLSRFDNYNQVVNARMILEEVDGEGTVLRRLYRDFQLRYAHRWELHHLLTSCGFRVVELYGDFQCSPFGPDSREMVWVVERAEEPEDRG